ncbi:MAG: cyclic nucleotide-binding domain-containing protein [Pseudomonadota bacterium]
MGVQLLQDLYLFKDLLPEELAVLSALAKVRTYNKDENIFNAGEPAHSLFVIRHGTVNIRFAGKDAEVEVARLGTGAHFGEMSFVDGQPRSATAIALERSELLEIGFDALRAHFEKVPATGMKFYRSLSHFLAGRLRITTTDLSFSREKNIRHF